MKPFEKLKNLITVPDEQYYGETAEDNDLPMYSEERSERKSEKAKTSRKAFREEDDRAAVDSSKVVGIHTTAKLQVVLRSPESIDELLSIADDLINTTTVVLNLDKCDNDVAVRILDFLAGVSYAKGGKTKRIAQNTYIITPYNVDVVGDLLDELENNSYLFG